MSQTLIILSIIAGILILLVGFVLIAAWRLDRRRKNLPPRPSFRCAKCGSDQIEVLSSGLWDGRDDEGNHIGGIFEYGTCRKCRSRCARHFDDRCYIPSDAQWDDEFKPIEKLERSIENWPFAADDDFYVRKASLKKQQAVEVSQFEV